MIRSRKLVIAVLTIMVSMLLITELTRRGLSAWYFVPPEFLAGWLVSWIFVKARTTKVPARSLLVQAGEIKTVFEEDAWFWNSQYENLFDDYGAGPVCMRSYAQAEAYVEIEKRTEPRLVCTLVFLRYQVPDDALAFENLLENWREKGVDGFQKLAEYLGNEFVQKYNEQLGGFFNPLDKKQQGEFCNLVAAFLKEFFPEKCILYVGQGTRFSLPTPVSQVKVPLTSD